MVDLWFKKGMMKRYSGFSKENSVTQNLAIMYKNANLKNPADKWLRVAHQAQILINLSKDKETVNISKQVAIKAYSRSTKLRIK